MDLVTHLTNLPPKTTPRPNLSSKPGTPNPVKPTNGALNRPTAPLVSKLVTPTAGATSSTPTTPKPSVAPNGTGANTPKLTLTSKPTTGTPTQSTVSKPPLSSKPATPTAKPVTNGTTSGATPSTPKPATTTTNGTTPTTPKAAANGTSPTTPKPATTSTTPKPATTSTTTKPATSTTPKPATTTTPKPATTTTPKPTTVKAEPVVPKSDTATVKTESETEAKVPETTTNVAAEPEAKIAKPEEIKKETPKPAKVIPKSAPQGKKNRIADSDDEDEVAPIIKLTTPAKKETKSSPVKKSSKKAESESESNSESDSEEDFEGESEGSSGSDSDSDEASDFMDVEETKKKASPKKASPKKASPKKPAPKKAASPKKITSKRKVESSESSEEEKKPVKKETKSPTKKLASKNKRKTESESEDEKPAKKKTKLESGKSKDTDKKRGKKDVKEEDERILIQDIDNSWKKGEKKNWKFQTLSHNGVVMAPDYTPLPKHVKMQFNGKPVDLTPEQEEFAFQFARYLETDHMQKPQFAKNFWSCWKLVLKKDHVIKNFEGCNFRPIHDYLMQQKEIKKNRPKEEKEKEKKAKEALKEKYGFAMIDGRKEAVGNFSMEPPGLFLGRGKHPKSGMWKKRIQPEDITLNISKGEKVPDAPKGHKWGGVVHNNEVAWLATWKAPVLNTIKYTQLGATSSLKGESDLNKFDLARSLVKKIDSIRKNYNKELTSDDDLTRQRATAIWVIDRLALRAGNEKNTDEAADTVGCCSLRVEHIKLHPPNKVEFDFLGKDSMRYNNTVEVDKLVYENFGKFIAKPKKPSDDVFDCLTTSSLNKYLSTLMPGLTAKVFRTFNASFCMQRELEKWDAKKNKNATSEEKLVFFNATSVQVAILCNHQRTVSKTHEAQMGKIDDQIAEDEGYMKDLKGWAKQFKKGVTPEKKEDKKKPKKKKGDESSEEEEVDKRPIPKSEEACLKKIESLENRIKKAKLKKQDKDNLKEVSTSTSKVNYIDPRITIAWCKKVDLDTSRVFTKTLREKFGWAYRAVEEDEEFAF